MRAQDIAAREIMKRRPKTLEDACAIAARCSAELDALPDSEDEVFAAAVGGARGLFGKAFDVADDQQRAIWIDAMEAALRSEMENK